MNYPHSPDFPCTLFFEDQHLIVLSKPAGLLSQGEHRGDPNLVDELRTYLGRHYVGLIHRLDRNTSGIMIVAKRTKSAQRLTTALQAGKIFRSYLAWVQGSLTQKTRWSHFLKKDPKQNLVKVVSPQGKEGEKQAILTVQPIQSGFWKQAQITLVEFILETGRSHQIRVQSAFEGFPLLGDIKYNPKGIAYSRVALHSHRLEFPHPMSGETLKFIDPLPEDLAVLNSFKNPAF